MGSVGYYNTSRTFSVESYKGEWIMRAILPADMPAAGNWRAEEAVLRWHESNRSKFDQVWRGESQ